jgi:hypothetical protein
MRKILVSLLFVFAASAFAQRPACTSGNINASYSDTVNNIQYLCTASGWKAGVGLGAPTVGCSAVNYGSSYADVQNNIEYTCGSSGWFQNPAPGGPFLPLAGGTLTGPLNGTDGNFSGTVAAGITLPSGAPAGSVGGTAYYGGNVPLIYEPTNPVLGWGSQPSPLGVDETTLIVDGGVCKIWFSGDQPSPAWTTVYYATATDASCKNYGVPVPVLSGVYHPHVVKISSTYYLFAPQTNTGDIYLYTSSDGITWTIANSGTPVLHQPTINGVLVNLSNASPVVIGTTVHLFLEGWQAGVDSSNPATFYSYSTVAAMSFDANVTGPVITNTHTPAPVYVASRNAVILLVYRPTSAGADYGSTIAYTALNSSNFGLSASWKQGAFLITGTAVQWNSHFSFNPAAAPSAVNAQMVIDSGLTYPTIINWTNGLSGAGTADSRLMFQGYSALSGGALYDAIALGNTPFPATITQNTSKANNSIDGNINWINLPQSVPSWHKYTIFNVLNGTYGCTDAANCWVSSGFNILIPHSTSGPGDLYVPIFPLPENGYIEGFRAKPKVACTGTTTAYVEGLGTAAVGPDYFTGNLHTSANWDIAVSPADTSIYNAVLTAPGSYTAGELDVSVSIFTAGGFPSAFPAGCAIDFWVKWGILP